MSIAAAGGIVFDERRRLLLILRSKPPAASTWSLPGGRCEPDELPEAACVREVAEETGLAVEVIRWAGRVHRLAPGGGIYVIDDFLCRVMGGTLLAGDDAADAGWFDLAGMTGLPLAAGLLEALAGWSLLPA
ncbi:MAG TPA: NUDIX domain-containing protein [Jatrophihabitans sp.]|jgi:ADP-ribose pyrophosphatase YjhB (NUDIX family)|uniref:NUDIX domain-containing protein n=1 Tax=Jatrophihabitans sp. TaxID=1932789 RepID=UPI002EE61AE9